MAREIKFRGWDKICKMRYDIPLTLNGRVVSGLNPLKDGTEHFTYNDNIILMQYTGLHDAKGKEIYEGDIVRTAINTIRVVEYVTTLHMARYLPSHLEYSEVIGNIYENPELLKDIDNGKV